MLDLFSEIMESAIDTARETLYVNNLNDRVKPEALKRALIPLFGKYGKIVDLVAMKSLWRRGQAFIVFETPEIANRAREALDGKVLFEKAMRVVFAKTASDATLKRKNLPITREKLPKMTAEESAAKMQLREKDGTEFFNPQAAPKLPQYTSLPNRTLFIENINQGAKLEELCSGFEGYEETRVIPGRGVAFVDFSFDYQAARAMQAINGKSIEAGFTLKASYAKK